MDTNHKALSSNQLRTPENTREALVAIRRVLDCFHIDGVADQMPAQQTVSPIRVGDIRKAREAADQLAAPVGEPEKEHAAKLEDHTTRWRKLRLAFLAEHRRCRLRNGRA